MDGSLAKSNLLCLDEFTKGKRNPLSEHDLTFLYQQYRKRLVYRKATLQLVKNENGPIDCPRAGQRRDITRSSPRGVVMQLRLY